tara:strand:- start:7619 stop:7846 length:228 start_codon:yes stop_codon:yes gene_type:complete
MTEYYEEKVLRYRVYKRPTLKLEDGSKYPWSLEWSFYSRVHAEEKLERPSYESPGLYDRKLVDAGQEETFRREVW